MIKRMPSVSIELNTDGKSIADLPYQNPTTPICLLLKILGFNKSGIGGYQALVDLVKNRTLKARSVQKSDGLFGRLKGISVCLLQGIPRIK